MVESTSEEENSFLGGGRRRRIYFFGKSCLLSLLRALHNVPTKHERDG
jgi:hypothetical protein